MDRFLDLLLCLPRFFFDLELECGPFSMWADAWFLAPPEEFFLCFLFLLGESSIDGSVHFFLDVGEHIISFVAFHYLLELIVGFNDVLFLEQLI